MLISGTWLSFITSCNTGAAFGQLDQFPRFLVGGRILAVLVLCVWLLRMDTRQRAVHAAMVLILAGACGNLVDNLWTGCGTEAAPYGVRDFVNVWFEPLVSWDYHFPSFNVADSCISVGAVLWIGSRPSSVPEVRRAFRSAGARVPKEASSEEPESTAASTPS